MRGKCEVRLIYTQTTILTHIHTCRHTYTFISCYTAYRIVYNNTINQKARRGKERKGMDR